MKSVLSVLLLVSLTNAAINNGLKSCEKHNDCGDTQWCYFSYDENHRPMDSGFCFAEMNPKKTNTKESNVEDVEDIVRVFIFYFFVTACTFSSLSLINHISIYRFFWKKV